MLACVDSFDSAELLFDSAELFVKVFDDVSACVFLRVHSSYSWILFCLMVCTVPVRLMRIISRPTGRHMYSGGWISTVAASRIPPIVSIAYSTRLSTYFVLFIVGSFSRWFRLLSL